MSSTAGGFFKSPSLISSSSTVTTEAVPGSHTLRIDDYTRTKTLLSTGHYIESCDFTVGPYTWCIHYYPNGVDPDSADYISLFLVLCQRVDKSVRVEYRIKFLDEVEAEEPPSVEYRKVQKFRSHDDHGYPRFIKRKELEKSCHLKNDSFTIQCDMALISFVAYDTTVSVAVPPSDLHQHLGNLLSSEKGVDVIFQVGHEALRAHRWLLAARSPVFSAELFGEMKESDSGVVRVDDMEVEVFKALLHFIYTDVLPDGMKQEEEYVMSQHLLVASDRYDLERLKFICENNLSKHVQVSNVAAILELADTHHCPRLKEACFDFLQVPENLEAVLATDIFGHLHIKCPSITLELIAKLSTKVQRLS